MHAHMLAANAFYTAVVVIHVLIYVGPPVCAMVGKTTTATAAADVNSQHKQQYFFWNEVTGEKQWEDPGGIPFEDESRLRFWIQEDTGRRYYTDPDSYLYVWVELFSDEYQRPYYYNQVTQETTWNKPADLAWRRVPLQ